MMLLNITISRRIYSEMSVSLLFLTENIPAQLYLLKVISEVYLKAECEIIVNQIYFLYKIRNVNIPDLYAEKSVVYGDYQQICISDGNVSVDLFRQHLIYCTFFSVNRTQQSGFSCILIFR